MLNQVSKQNASGVGATVTTQIGCDSNMVKWSIKISKDAQLREQSRLQQSLLMQRPLKLCMTIMAQLLF